MEEKNQILEFHNSLVDSEINFFTAKGIAVKVSNNQGVYIIYSKNHEVLYVGTTKIAKGGLNQRLNNHRNGGSSFSKKYLKPKNINLSKDCTFKYIEEDDARNRVLLEALTIGLLCPAHIGTGEKSQVSHGIHKN